MGMLKNAPGNVNRRGILQTTKTPHTRRYAAVKNITMPDD